LRLVDLTAVLTCCVYVDLNPIRAGVADRPENSEYTSVRDRIQDWLGFDAAAEADVITEAELVTVPDVIFEAGVAMPEQTPAPARCADWLIPIPIVESPRSNTTSADSEDRPPRASDLGLLPMSLEEYLQLVDWTGRQVRSDKPGAIPETLQPILDRLRLPSEHWLELTTRFTELFGRIAGRSELVIAAAKTAGKRWFQGVRTCATMFG
jgi:hypothetical protein